MKPYKELQQYAKFSEDGEMETILVHVHVIMTSCIIITSIELHVL